ncbi:beta-ketoacyl synthase N-terminal-like domain-containing protein [Urechidicola croceus]|uniref:Beta-ketoacyl synthase n=1 Tax=Urechidicola croceus TaxID=1850246 RepID=A0A1D8P8M2_9FLAO|nr:beta-ketoacyl synthase N-terminal-like domain-containing protein [Urechidicola croceus]AOW20922.1 beta-ketoacyl synthase [Urechidicola croceus]
MQNSISITSIASVSPLGSQYEYIWQRYLDNKHLFVKNKLNVLIAPLSDEVSEEIEKLRLSDNKYKSLDKSVLMAIYASRKAVKKANWSDGDFGINIGSSRGATALFEKYHEDFLERNKTETLASPTTTLGNISSWIAHDLQSQGPTISHSITCSTALHAVLNGIAWINSGMSEKFLVGGSEAPLTPFTIAQMKALKIYASTPFNGQSSVERHSELVSESHQQYFYPSKTLDFSKKRNTMILGEGASVMCLEKGIKDNAIATIEGVGYATEILKHNISISDDAICFQKSMKMALQNIDPSEVDVVVMHAPGTIKGDTSEYKAMQSVFGETIPALTSNKWKIGHTFGASGALSIELAILMMQHQKFINIPFLESQKQPSQIKKVLVNAVGFGGNAVSILLSK